MEKKMKAVFSEESDSETFGAEHIIYTGSQSNGCTLISHTHI